MICIADKKRGLLLRIRRGDYYWGYDWGLVRQYSTLFLSTMLSYSGVWGNKKTPVFRPGFSIYFFAFANLPISIILNRFNLAT